MSFKKHLFQRAMRLLGTSHPSSYPYISSDSFRAVAHHALDVIDKTTIPPAVCNGDIIFVNSVYLKDFFSLIHPHIKARYILITHNGIETIEQAYCRYLDDRIIHWFGKNMTVKHPKMTPIPIGLENLCDFNTGVISMFRSLQKKLIKERRPRIFFHFKITTNPKQRQVAFDYLTKHPCAETLKSKLDQFSYLKYLMKYAAVASPEGAGIECHRTWEALYLGVVPIVKRSYMLDYFYSLGIPLWIIDSWEDLNSFDETSIIAKCQEIKKSSSVKPLYMDFWIAKIEAARKNSGVAIAPLPGPRPLWSRGQIYRALMAKFGLLITRKVKNSPMRLRSDWRRLSKVIRRKTRCLRRRIFGFPAAKNIYSFVILAVKRPEYVSLTINNINSCHFINPSHTFTIYCDDICEAAWKKESRRLDYPKQVCLKNKFGQTVQPWQYSKIETIIDAAQQGIILIDADELWHSDIAIDAEKITFMVRPTVFKNNPDERTMIENIFKKSEWLEFRHCTTSLVSIPKHLLTDKLARNMRRYVRDIFDNPLTFFKTDRERNNIRRIAEELAIDLAVQEQYPQEKITALKESDGPKNTDFLQPLYYGCANKILE